MINKPYLVRVDGNTIINLENVTTIERRGEKLFISLIGDSEEAIILEGDEAKAMWIYFASSMMSFQPLKVTNPGRNTLDEIPNSIGEQSH